MSILRHIWNKWQAFGKAVGDLVGRVVMTVFYFTFALPFGIGVRIFGDPLRLRPGAPRWEPREAKPATLEDARRNF